MADGEAQAETAKKSDPKKSDLGVRTLSAIVMLAIGGTALWLGGWWWTALVIAIALGVMWEWHHLVTAFPRATAISTLAWDIGGVAYIGLASVTLASLRFRHELGTDDAGLFYVLLFACTVIGVDVGAYFTGRTFGGPKIAPSISPSKTWSGLIGGALGATAAIVAVYASFGYDWSVVLEVAWIAGPIVAVVAQAGDFFESWMKRRAGKKDSGNFIPGHGGFFDRVDGLLAVLFIFGVAIFVIGIGRP